jgi:TPR repeat protein
MDLSASRAWLSYDPLAACNKGKGQICLEFGVRYVDGAGVTKDDTKALEFYLKVSSSRSRVAREEAVARPIAPVDAIVSMHRCTANRR